MITVLIFYIFISGDLKRNLNISLLCLKLNDIFSPPIFSAVLSKENRLHLI